MSHEIRTPMNANIRGFSEILNRKLNDANLKTIRTFYYDEWKGVV